jgi:hypothetical protein
LVRHTPYPEKPSHPTRAQFFKRLVSGSASQAARRAGQNANASKQRPGIFNLAAPKRRPEGEPIVRSCLVSGKHTPGSEWERECPLNPNRAADRQAEKARRAQAEHPPSPAQRTARAAFAKRFASKKPAGNTNPQGTSDGPLPDRISPVSLDEVSITPAPDEVAAKAARGGRPRKHATNQIARREAQRTYRERRKPSAT